MRRATDISCLEALPCPLCGESLERGAGRQGLVWICRTCRGGAVTLPILRKFAPKPFVNHLWQTALRHGHPSALVCPACMHRFTEVTAGTTPQIKACVRCYWVWLDCDVLDSLTTVATPTAALPPPRRALTSRRRTPASTGRTRTSFD
jgi:Zn-finger nucleic acid-binding protein